MGCGRPFGEFDAPIALWKALTLEFHHCMAVAEILTKYFEFSTFSYAESSTLSIIIIKRILLNFQPIQTKSGPKRELSNLITAFCIG